MRPKQKILTLPIRLVLCILIIGALFKVMHWPYSKELMLIGGSFVGVLYIIRFLYKKPKKALDVVKLALVLSWLFNYLINAFHILNVPYIFELVLTVLFIWWFIVEGLYYFKERKLKNNLALKILYYIISGLTIFCILFGILFKIQHWPYGSLMFTIGMLLLCLFLIVDYFAVKRA